MNTEATHQHHAPLVISDADLAYMAQALLSWTPSLSPAAVRAEVEAGWIILSGEVHWHYQRQDAVNCVRSLPGVVGVRDHMTVRA